MNTLLKGTGKHRAVDEVERLRAELADAKTKQAALTTECREYASKLIDLANEVDQHKAARTAAEQRAEKADRERALLGAQRRRADRLDSALVKTQAMPRFEPNPKAATDEDTSRIPTVPSTPTVRGPYRVPITVVPLGAAATAGRL